jgi:hypothetical protein
MGLEDIKLWQEARKRITTKMERTDFRLMCLLHSRYFNHKYSEPCTCNKVRLRQWIEQLDNKLK